MVIDHFHFMCIARIPAEDDAPLIVDPNRMAPGAIALECLQTIPRRRPKIGKVARVVQVEELSPRRPVQLRRKPPHNLRLPIVEEVFGEPVSERANHGIGLSQLDNYTSPELAGNDRLAASHTPSLPYDESREPASFWALARASPCGHGHRRIQATALPQGRSQGRGVLAHQNRS